MDWTKGRTLAVVRIYGQGKWDCVEEFKALKDVFHVEDCPTGSSVRELRVIYKTQTFTNLLSRFGVILKTPIRINNGASTWEVVGTNASIQRLIDAMHRSSIDVTLDPLYRNSEELVLSKWRWSHAMTAAPSPTDKKGTEHIVICRWNASLPSAYWFAEITRRHPDASIEVLGYSLADDGMFVDIRVRTQDIAAWAEELRASGDVYDAKPLGGDVRTTTLRVTCKGYEFMAAVYRMHMVLRTPFIIKDGSTVVNVVGPEESLRRFIKMFPEIHIQVEAVYNSERDKEALLTPRQSEIFRKAMAAGYFEVPRRVTLTELAARVGVAVSTLSEMLAVVEKKLLQDSQTVRPQ
jgi:predicted DNA binding protein